MTARTRWVLAAVATISSIAWTFGVTTDRVQAAYSYLFAFVYVLTIVVGTLFLLMIGHASQAKWFVPLRRSCERVVGCLPFMVLLWVVPLLLVRDLYPWTHPERLAAFVREHVEQKVSWLNIPFFVGRSVLYMALLVLVGERLCSWSRQQDTASVQEARTLRLLMVRFSVGGLVLSSLVLTLVGWDWVMSLEPAWYSNLYGVYLFAGGLLSALGMLGVLTVRGRAQGRLPAEISSCHYHAIGRLELAFVIFWGYIGWCHVLEQWIANLPLEALWHLRRWHHGWQWEGLALIGLGFVLPFFLLLFRSIKKNPRTFALVSGGLVVVHILDIHYLVLPALHRTKFVVHWLDPVALVALSSLTVLFGSLRGRTLEPVPKRDPLMVRGLAYESQS